MPTSRAVDYEEMSSYTQEIFAGNDVAKRNNIGKRLVADLKEKKDVLLHYIYLKNLVRLGAQVEIVKVLTITQEPFMKQFVLDRKIRRDQALDEFTKQMLKFIINSQFGKVISTVPYCIEL